MVAADVGDDFGDWAVGDVVFEVGAVEAFEKFGAQGFLVVGLGLALDGVFDVSDDALARRGAVGGRLAGFGELFPEHDGAADGLGHSIVGSGGFLRLDRAVLLREGLAGERNGEFVADGERIAQDPAALLQTRPKTFGGRLAVAEAVSGVLGCWLIREQIVIFIVCGYCSFCMGWVVGKRRFGGEAGSADAVARGRGGSHRSSSALRRLRSLIMTSTH